MDTKYLELFNQRANKLATSRFLAWLEKRGNKQPDMSRLLDGDWLAYEDLNHEDLDAFCLNLRLLIQDRDGFSIRCIKYIYEELPDNYDEAKKLFFDETNKLNEYLDKKSLVQIQGQESLTHRDILNIVIYGGIAHNDEKYYEDFLRLTKAGLFSFFTFFTLWNIVFKLNTSIQRIAIINQQIIQLETKTSKSL